MRKILSILVSLFLFNSCSSPKQNEQVEINRSVASYDELSEIINKLERGEIITSAQGEYILKFDLSINFSSNPGFERFYNGSLAISKTSFKNLMRQAQAWSFASNLLDLFCQTNGTKKFTGRRDVLYMCLNSAAEIFSKNNPGMTFQEASAINRTYMRYISEEAYSGTYGSVRLADKSAEELIIEEKYIQTFYEFIKRARVNPRKEFAATVHVASLLATKEGGKRCLDIIRYFFSLR
jgi:hypothetical protein